MRRYPTRQLLLMLALAASPVACGAGQEGTAAEDCTAFQARAEAVWNEQVQDDLGFPVRVLKGEIDAADAEYVVTRLNHFTRNWVRLRENACRAHSETGALDDFAYQERAACLDANLESQGAVIAAALNDSSSMLGELEFLFKQLRTCVPEDSGTNLEVRDNPFAAATAADAGMKAE